MTAASPLPNALAADCARWKPTVFPPYQPCFAPSPKLKLNPTALASLRLVISAGAPLTPEIANAAFAPFRPAGPLLLRLERNWRLSFDRTGMPPSPARAVSAPRWMASTCNSDRQGASRSKAPPSGRRPPFPARPGRTQCTGELVLAGRTGRTAKIGGRRIDLGEIEKLLQRAPGVREAYAILHPSRPDAIAAGVAGRHESRHITQSLRARTALWKISERLLVLPRASPQRPRQNRPQAIRETIGRSNSASAAPSATGRLHSTFAICSRMRSSSFFNSITLREITRSLALLPIV